jgi:hypothetical protein
MKNKLKILTILAIGILLFPTCQKDPDLRMPDLQTGIIPLIEKDATKDLNLSFLDLAGFNATVKVDLYYADKPKSMNLMVSMNDDAENTAVVKSNINSFPTSVDVTTANLVDILPGLDSINQLQLGDYFRFYVDVTLEDGTVINGSDTLYAAYSADILSLPGASLDVVYTVVCPLDPAMTVGSYHVISLDWVAEGDVTITADLEDPNTVYVAGLAAIEGLVEDQGPLVMHLDPLTYEVIADRTVIATDYWGYTNGAFGGSGTYNTCTGGYVMKYEISVDEGSFGEYTFTFTRN